jgi:hypothetical protein
MELLLGEDVHLYAIKEKKSMTTAALLDLRLP